MIGLSSHTSDLEYQHIEDTSCICIYAFFLVSEFWTRGRGAVVEPELDRKDRVPQAHWRPRGMLWVQRAADGSGSWVQRVRA